MNYDYKSILFIILLVIIIAIYNNYTKKIEGYQNNTNKWSTDLIKRFNIYQTTMNNNVNQYDLELLQKHYFLMEHS